jgi:hypothetical protein
VYSSRQQSLGHTRCCLLLYTHKLSTGHTRSSQRALTLSLLLLLVLYRRPETRALHARRPETGQQQTQRVSSSVYQACDTCRGDGKRHGAGVFFFCDERVGVQSLSSMRTKLKEGAARDSGEAVVWNSHCVQKYEDTHRSMRTRVCNRMRTQI